MSTEVEGKLSKTSVQERPFLKKAKEGHDLLLLLITVMVLLGLVGTASLSIYLITDAATVANCKVTLLAGLLSQLILVALVLYGLVILIDQISERS